ncbi:MarR family winged helix-turn-helix transcriptional regulator [Microbispora hainanensis]|uniref:MarR family winged helix-turn-helix transcriptional regulator n=1 Tax=Microbispora hainanensis TaxID=568844 RepID=UPI001FCC0E07|nr:MarR family transcriptional regulator [Microbispora hainanensis]
MNDSPAERRAGTGAASAPRPQDDPATREKIGEDAERGCLITRLAELQRSMGRFFARDRSMPLLASTLTMQQLKVVMFLSFAGSTSGQELARHLGVGLGTVTGIVDRVVAQGLASRHEDPHDRRVRRVELTDAGRRLTSEIVEAGTGGYIRLLRRLDTETLRTMETVMRRIEDVMREMHAEDAGPPDPSP